MPRGSKAVNIPEVMESRRLPVGAEVIPGGGVHFRVWAPVRKRVEVVVEGDAEGAFPEALSFELGREETGYFSSVVESAHAGTRYRYRLDGENVLYPDPASRFQPDGPDGPSQVIDPGAFEWTDGKWKGVAPEGQVIYEMHIGTFTREGRWDSALPDLDALRDTGVTVLEIMPVGDFPGRFGWGYDGVNIYAPTRLYGAPDDFRRFVNRAHEVGMGVILDVVYNHVGPDGNYLPQFCKDYFTDRYKTDWGKPFNFDGANSGPVRDFIVFNAGYWIDEFHLDGLRLDATQNIYDTSPEHIIAAVARRAREAARGRFSYIIAENEPQDVKLLRPFEKGGYGLDALWNDDFHHTAMVALTGYNEAYYTDYKGSPQEFISCAKWGYLFQGQWYKWQMKRRGTPTMGLKPYHFISFIQNHDQVANSGRGLRVQFLSGPGQYKAMTALLLLGTETPMLFQGQEFASSSPFFYFANQKEDISKDIYLGRVNFLAQFRSLAQPEMRAKLPDPADPETFVRSKLDLSERSRHAEMYSLHRDLLRLRREDRAFVSSFQTGRVDGAVLEGEAFLLRFFGEDGDDRLLVVNFGRYLNLNPAPEPLLAPPENTVWCILWSSEDPRYGGTGTAPLDTEDNWFIPGHAAVVLAPAPREEVAHD